MKRLLAFVALNLIGIAAMVLLAMPAAAANACFSDRARLVMGLEKKFGETVKGQGLSVHEDGPTTLLEIYNSEKTGTWTVLESLPDGSACILAVGTDWGMSLVVQGNPI